MSKILFLTVLFSHLALAEINIDGKFLPDDEFTSRTCGLIHDIQKPDSELFLAQSSFTNITDNTVFKDPLVLLCKECTKAKSERLLKTPPTLQPNKWTHAMTPEIVSTRIWFNNIEHQKKSTTCFKGPLINSPVSVPKDPKCGKKVLFHYLTEGLPSYQKAELVRLKTQNFVDYYQTCRLFFNRLEEDNFLTKKWKDFMSRRNYPGIHKELELNDSDRCIVRDAAGSNFLRRASSSRQ